MASVWHVMRDHIPITGPPAAALNAQPVPIARSRHQAIAILAAIGNTQGWGNHHVPLALQEHMAIEATVTLAGTKSRHSLFWVVFLVSGYYSAVQSAGAYYACRPGQFSSLASAYCQSCQPGSVAPYYVSASCQKCPVGK